MKSCCVLIAILLVFVTCPRCSASSGPHISDVNILLPPKMTNPVEYRLRGSDGCFIWSWDHHDILSVHPEYNSSSHCSTSARLRSIAPYNGRKETAVYATDTLTGAVVRCNVFIDNFYRIRIIHSSTKLDFDGLSALRVRAFDNEENVFSSLVGLQFMWQLMPEANELAHHLTHVPLKESPLGEHGESFVDLDIQIKLEDSGVFSDLYVVKGTGIGHEIVSVHLLEPEFESTEYKIVLSVAEEMSVAPHSPVSVLVGATVHYSLRVIRAKIRQVVTLPSPFHRWSVLNSTVAEVDELTGSAHALSLGVTVVIVEDTRVAGHTKLSYLHVVLPEVLSLYMLPLSPLGDYIDGIEPTPPLSVWYLVTGKTYLIQMKIFAQAQEIHITESDDAKLHDDDSGLWNMHTISDDLSVNYAFLTSRILETASCGRGKLMATLTCRTGNYMTKEVVQEVMVCDQVRFSFGHSNVSGSILLPWAPGIYQELDLNAAGGCATVSSDFKWSSSDLSTVSISAYGILQARNPGRAIIKVESTFDPFNYDEVVIEVSIPYSMVMFPNFPVETSVGSHLPAAVTMEASNGAYFHRCDAFSASVKWNAGSESFTIRNVTRDSFFYGVQFGPACAWTHLFAASSGHILLHATLSMEFQPRPIILEASLRIAAYLPLILHEVGDGNHFGGYLFDFAEAEVSKKLENLKELYLVPGTILDVMLSGGPEQWGHGVEFIESVATLEENRTPHKDEGILPQSSRGSEGAYRISCQKLGTYRLIFKRGNLVGDTHPLPAIEKVELLLRCRYPAAIVVMANEPGHELDVIRRASQAGRSPERIHAIAITVANTRAIRLSAVGISESGKAFGNSSSLYLMWELSDCADLASWDTSYDLTKSKPSWDRFLVLHNASGLCLVRATVTGLLDNADSHVSSVPLQIGESVLTDAIQLQVSLGASIYPQYPVLHVGNRLHFSVEAENDVLSGQWLSGNGSILSVDIESGMAEAMGEGTTQVIYEGSNCELQTTVEVVERTAVFFDAPMDLLTNAPFPAKGYRFPLKFSDAYIRRHEEVLGNVPILYDCEVDPPFIGYAKPWKDLDRGIPCCIFFPYSPEYLVRVVPSSKEIGHGIPVSISMFLKEANITASVSALFIGGFFVDKNPMQLNLTGANRSIITIRGNTDVEVDWSNRDQLIINCIHKEGFGISGHAEYEVRVLGDYANFTDKIIFSLPANGQTVEIDVIYETMPISWGWLLVIIPCYMLAVFILWAVCMGK